MLRRLYALALSAGVLCASASTLSRQDRLSPLAAGYLERAKIMLTGGNYAGVIDQLKHLDTQNIALQPSEREDCAYLLALAMYQRGDSDCVDLLREFAEAYPASPQALPARLAAADYFFFSHHFDNALAAYNDIDYARINPADRPLYDYRKALSMVKTGLYDEAEPIFRELRDTRGFSTPADYYLAYIDYANGNYEEAYRGFSSVADEINGRDGQGMEPLYYMAQIDYAFGEYEKVIKSGKSLLKEERHGDLLPETERIVGMSYFKLDDYQEAKRFLDSYVAHKETSPSSDAVYALGVIDYSEGEYDKAQRKFSSLIDLNNDLSQSAYLYLGQIAVEQGDNNAAAISFEKASKMNFDPKVTEAALFNYIAARTHGGNIPFSSSIPVLNGFLRQFPGSKYAPGVREYLATAYFNEKNYAGALESVNKIPNPSKAVLTAKQKILYELGMEAMANNRPADARDYLSDAVSLRCEPSLTAQANLWLGDADYALGKYAGAEKAYQAYLRADRRGENSTLAKYNLAYAQLMQDKYSAAAASFANALKSDPLLPRRQYDDALIRMADAQYYAGDYRLALKNYTTAIENGAADSDYAMFRRAVMYGLGGDIKTKIAELNSLPSLFPGSKWLPNALLEKGQTYAGLGQTEEAVKSFEQLRSSHKQTAQARKGMLNLAIAYMQTKDYDNALGAYREVISKWPTSEEASLANDDLRRYYSSHGGLQEYAEFLRTVPEAPQIDASEIEKLAFEGAETVFADDVTDTALLEKYVEDYPNGRYLAQALLDIATGKMENGNHEEALTMLDALLERRGDAPQVPEALLMKAQMLEEAGAPSRKEAALTYRLLEEKGGADYAADAYAGIMRNTDDDNERMRYAALVKESGGLSADQVEEAEYYEAYSRLNNGDAKEAVETLRRLASNPKSLSGAKAAVVLGQHLLNNGDVNGADKVLTAFTDEGSPHEYWLARGFIALADVCHKRGKDYLAVEYLKSLRDNYPGKELDIHDMISSRLEKWK